MRQPVIATLILLSVSAAIFLGLKGRAEVDLLRAAPASALAALVVNDPASDLDLADRIDWGDWFSGDPAGLLERIPAPVREQMEALMDEDLEKALLIVHRLEKRESGAWKIHFTALLRPKARRGLMAERRIEAAIVSVFGSSMTTTERESLRIYQGERPEQTLHQVRLPGFLVVSNTGEGRDEVLGSWIGKRPRLTGRRGFQFVAERLPTDRGLFFYCDCAKLLPLLPEFGYQIQRVGGQVRDRAVVAP